MQEPHLFNPLSTLSKPSLEWWQGTVIYEIYIRSFLEGANEDNFNERRGVGNLSGIIRRLDYIKSLGVDVIWITPFYCSPMKDFGYDVRNYTAIASEFGTIQDFKDLIAEAKARELRIIIDQVWSHTSDEHPWFLESREAILDADKAAHSKADWYIWRDAQEDGRPPNNWFSFFGGSAWAWDPEVQKYYLHHFLSSQPALNLRNPALQREIFRVAEFWLDLNVDGFRLDAVQYWMFDQDLRNNPPQRTQTNEGVDNTNTSYGLSTSLPSVMQKQVFNMYAEDVKGFVKKLRSFVDNKYPDYPRLLLGELAGPRSQEMAGHFTKKYRMNLTYDFSLLQACQTPHQIVQIVKSTLNGMEAEHLELGTTCWCFSNHDVMRVVDRWGHYVPEKDKPRFAKVIMTLQLALPGSVSLYQGEELGLPQALLDDKDLQDPYDRSLGKKKVGRDGARTPMPWHSEQPYLGFSSEQPWIALPQNLETYRSLAVDAQQQDPNSVLTAFRHLITWRKQHRLLITKGQLRILSSIESPLLAFTRTYSAPDSDYAEEVLFVFNFGTKRSRFPLQGDWFECYSIKSTDSNLSSMDFLVDHVESRLHYVVLPPLSVLIAKFPEH